MPPMLSGTISPAATWLRVPADSMPGTRNPLPLRRLEFTNVIGRQCSNMFWRHRRVLHPGSYESEVESLWWRWGELMAGDSNMFWRH
jgi:hypothetical protein